MTKLLKQRGGWVCLADTGVKYFFNGWLKAIIALATSAHPYLTEKYSLGREKQYYISLTVDSHGEFCFHSKVKYSIQEHLEHRAEYYFFWKQLLMENEKGKQG